MTTSKISILLVLLTLCGCQVPVATDPIATICPDVEIPEGEYRLSVPAPIELVSGEWTEIPVCVSRGLGMEAPIILVAQGMPEYVEVETRENRLEDFGPTILRVRVASEEEAFGETPGPSRTGRFTITGFSGLDQGHETTSVTF